MHLKQHVLIFLVAAWEADLAACMVVRSLVRTRQKIVVHLASGRFAEVGTVVME